MKGWNTGNPPNITDLLYRSPSTKMTPVPISAILFHSKILPIIFMLDNLSNTFRNILHLQPSSASAKEFEFSKPLTINKLLHWHQVRVSPVSTSIWIWTKVDCNTMITGCSPLIPSCFIPTTKDLRLRQHRVYFLTNCRLERWCWRIQSFANQ